MTTPEVVTKPLPYTKDQCFTNVLTTCEYENCAQGVTNELTTWNLPIKANQLTHLFVLARNGGYTNDDVISIYRLSSIPHPHALPNS